VTLLPPFARDPQAPAPGEPGWIPGESPLAGAIRLSIDGPVKTTHWLLPDVVPNVPVLEAALRAHDISAIYALDREYAPFWCPPCGKSYCRNCWVVWVPYDEGFYDCTRGRCPESHERIMDD